MYSEDPTKRHTPEQMLERLRLAFDLFQAGERMMWMKLKRQFPQADDAEIERRLLEWLQRE